MITTLDQSSRAAARGFSDISIRNLFIIPTILFLIVFNIFPLIYSLGYSFTDFRASTNAPANFVGLQNYRDLLNDPYVWSNFAITAKYVIISVVGQLFVGFGVAMLLNRDIPLKGLLTTLLLVGTQFFAPTARTASAAQTLESMPPDRPSTRPRLRMPRSCSRSPATMRPASAASSSISAAAEKGRRAGAQAAVIAPLPALRPPDAG